MPPRKATDRCGNTTHDYPRHRDDGEKVLIGLVNGTAEYYDRTQNRVKGVVKHDGEFSEEMSHQLGTDETVVDHVQQTREAYGEYDELTGYAKGMCRAEKLAQTGAITRPQAEVYVLRSEQGLLRQDVAKMLGKSPSTLDSLLVKAKDKIERAHQLSQESASSGDSGVVDPVRNLAKKVRGNASPVISDDVDRDIIDITITARERQGSARISTAVPEDTDSEEFALRISAELASVVENDEDAIGTGIARDGFFRKD
jgi:hypothetical protein